MSLPFVFIIMVVAGILGGSVNYLLPANETPEKTKFRNWFQCVVLGFGATFLVPLFLEIAQSKLMDHMHLSFSLSGLKEELSALTTDDTQADVLKNYLLFGSYCLLAAAAGFRFINMLINNVVKEQTLIEKNHQLKKLQKINEKREKNSQISQAEEAENIRANMLTRNSGIAMASAVLPSLPPITHPEDPQKGRFGGKSSANSRELMAEVAESNIPGFYRVDFWVESTDPDTHPLRNDVIFYIHDSFSPSVYTIQVNEFEDGKAKDRITSFGAFTIGAITDNGATLLELDLSENSKFPKTFRTR